MSNIESILVDAKTNLELITDEINNLGSNMEQAFTPFVKINDGISQAVNTAFKLENFNPLGPMFAEAEKGISVLTEFTPKPLFDGIDNSIIGINDVKDAIANIPPLNQVDFTSLGDVQGLVGSLSGVNDAFVSIGENVFGLQGFDPLGPIFDGVSTGLGIFSTFKDGMGELTKLIDLQKLATDAQAAAQGALNFIMNLNPMQILIIAIVALIAAFVLLWNNCEGFRNFFIGLWDMLKGVGAWIGETFMGIFKKVGEVIGNVFSGLKNIFVDVINFIINGLNSYIKIILLPINVVIKGLNKIPGVEISEIKLEIPNIPKMAMGGIPEYGQLFIAREAGPEFVGKMGSNNVVANNDQIVSSVSEGVFKAVKSAMAGMFTPQPQAPQEIKVYLDGKEIYINQLQHSEKLGFSSSLNPVFAR